MQTSLVEQKLKVRQKSFMENKLFQLNQRNQIVFNLWILHIKDDRLLLNETKYIILRASSTTITAQRSVIRNIYISLSSY